MRYFKLAEPCILVVAMSLSCAAQPQCTQEMIRGTWVNSITGFSYLPGSPMPVPGVTLAIFKIDWQGRLTATGPISLAGQIITGGQVAGSIQVNSDCTATANFTIYIPGMTPAPIPGVESMVIVDHGNQMWSLPSQEPLGQSATLETLRRVSIGDPQCSNNTVVGQYGASYQGYAMITVPGQSQPVPAPISYVGTAAVDFQGRMRGGGTYSIGGAIANVTLSNATMQINPDCTGTFQYSFVPPGAKQAVPGSDSLVVLNNGEEIVLMTLQGVLGPPTALGSMKRISRSF